MAITAASKTVEDSEKKGCYGEKNKVYIIIVVSWGIKGEKKKRTPTTAVVPRLSPIQILGRPNATGLR